MKVTGINGTVYVLEQTPIGSGSGGDIFCVSGMDYAAKIYKPGTMTETFFQMQLWLTKGHYHGLIASVKKTFWRILGQVHIWVQD